jgi:hypothetical protein
MMKFETGVKRKVKEKNLMHFLNTMDKQIKGMVAELTLSLGELSIQGIRLLRDKHELGLNPIRVRHHEYGLRRRIY